MSPLIGLVIAYLAGSIPFAYLAGRLMKGIDLRTVGSGNLGATNGFRTLGAPAGVSVMLLDITKGAVPVYWLPRLLGVGAPVTDSATWWALAYGVMAIVGHAKPIFLMWKGGGKGVATAAGIFLAVIPGPLLGTFAVFALTSVLSGYVSVGSLTAATLFPLWVWFDRGASPVLYTALVVGVFVWWTHRANISRLRAGTEGRVFGKKKAGGRS